MSKTQLEDTVEEVELHVCLGKTHRESKSPM